MEQTGCKTLGERIKKLCIQKRKYAFQPSPTFSLTVYTDSSCASACLACFYSSLSSSAMTAEALADTAATITTTTITTSKINANIPNKPNMIPYPFVKSYSLL